MRALGGFLVLLGPLVAAVVWLVVCLGVMLLLSRYFKFFKRGGIQLAALFAMFLLLFADEIAGRIYLNHLCSTEAGVKVYQTVELPAEYWDEKGRPRFFNIYGNLERDFWVANLDEPAGNVKRYSTVFAIDKDTSFVKEKSSQKVLAEVSTFRFWGGWLSRNFSPHNTAASCEFIQASDFSRKFYGQLFKPTISTR